MGTIRKFDLKDLALTKGIKTFIETGTLYGDGVDYALDNGFEKIISIEIDHDLAEQAKLKYSNNKNVTIYEGSSTDILKQILPSIDEPAVFWLDAHFPGVDAHKASIDQEIERKIKIPLEYELELIKQRNKPDVIICDDLWIYHEWETGTGTFDTHCKNHGHNISRKDLKVDGLLEKFEQMFEDTHKTSLFYVDQGYFAFIPV